MKKSAYVARSLVYAPHARTRGSPHEEKLNLTVLTRVLDTRAKHLEQRHAIRNRTLRTAN